MYQPTHRRFGVSDPAALLGEITAAAPATLVTMGPDGFWTSVVPMIFDPTVGTNGVLRGHLARPNPQWTSASDGAGGQAEAWDGARAQAEAGEGAWAGAEVWEEAGAGAQAEAWDGAGAQAEARDGKGARAGARARAGADPGEGAWAEAGEGTPAIAIVHGPDAYISPAWYEEKTRTGRVVPTWNYVVVVAHGTLTVHDDADWLRTHVRALVDRHEAMRPEPWSVDDAPAGYIDGQVRGIVGFELKIERIEAKRKLSQNRSPADVAGVIAALDEGTTTERAVAEAMRQPVEAE